MPKKLSFDDKLSSKGTPAQALKMLREDVRFCLVVFGGSTKSWCVIHSPLGNPSMPILKDHLEIRIYSIFAHLLEFLCEKSSIIWLYGFLSNVKTRVLAMLLGKVLGCTGSAVCCTPSTMTTEDPQGIVSQTPFLKGIILEIRKFGRFQ